MTELTQTALDVIPRARLEAKRLGFPFIQREQLFLALLSDGYVARILQSLGLDLDITRQKIEAQLLPGLGAPDDPEAIGMLPTAEQVFAHRSQTAVTLLGHTHRGPEHILVGFLLEQHGVVLEVLTAQGATKERVMAAIKSLDH